MESLNRVQRVNVDQLVLPEKEVLQVPKVQGVNGVQLVFQVFLVFQDPRVDQDNLVGRVLVDLRARGELMDFLDNADRMDLVDQEDLMDLQVPRVNVDQRENRVTQWKVFRELRESPGSLVQWVPLASRV